MTTLRPVHRTCMICESTFLAEWCRYPNGIWFAGEVCWACEDAIRRSATGESTP